MAYDDRLINYTREGTRLYIYTYIYETIYISYIYILLHLRTVTIGVDVRVVVGLNDGPRLGPDDGSSDDGFMVGLWGGSRAARGFRNKNSEYGSSWYGSSL